MRFVRFCLPVVLATGILSACSGQNSTLTPQGSAPVSATPTPGATATAAPTATATPVPSATPTAPPTVVPTATPSPSASPVAQRVAAQALLSAVRPVLLEDQLQEGIQEKGESIGRRPLVTGLRRDASGTCNDGVEYSSTASGNTTNFTLDFFYDAACTMPWQLIAGKETATATGEDLTAADTVDGTNGVVVEYDSVTGSITVSESSVAFALTGSTGPSKTSVTGQLGADCTIMATASGESESCSFGGLGPVPNLSGFDAAGTVLSEMSTVTESSTGVTTMGSGTGTFYEGTQPPMTLTNSGTALAITGSTLQKTLSSTLKIVQSSGATPTATFTVTDASDGTYAIVNLSGYTLTGKIENLTTKAVEATFTTDINGYGTITYSNGATATIVAFSIQA